MFQPCLAQTTHPETQSTQPDPPQDWTARAKKAKGRDVAEIVPREIAALWALNPEFYDEPTNAKPPRSESQSPAKPRQPTRPRAPSNLRPFDPDDLYIPTMKELLAEVRRRPVGGTVAYICADLAVVPAFCESDFWTQLFTTLRWHGGDFGIFFKLRSQREKTFQKERDRRPDTWHLNWRAPCKDTVRQVLGCLIGEPPPLDPPAAPDGGWSRQISSTP